MRRFWLLITTKNDNIDLVKFGEEWDILLRKYGCMGCLDEAVNPIIIDDKNNDTGYS